MYNHPSLYHHCMAMNRKLYRGRRIRRIVGLLFKASVIITPIVIGWRW